MIRSLRYKLVLTASLILSELCNHFEINVFVKKLTADFLESPLVVFGRAERACSVSYPFFLQPLCGCSPELFRIKKNAKLLGRLVKGKGGVDLYS